MGRVVNSFSYSTEDEQLIKEIEQEAKRQGLDKSKLIVDLLKEWHKKKITINQPLDLSPTANIYNHNIDTGKDILNDLAVFRDKLKPLMSELGVSESTELYKILKDLTDMIKRGTRVVFTKPKSYAEKRLLEQRDRQTEEAKKYRAKHEPKQEYESINPFTLKPINETEKTEHEDGQVVL